VLPAGPGARDFGCCRWLRGALFGGGRWFAGRLLVGCWGDGAWGVLALALLLLGGLLAFAWWLVLGGGCHGVGVAAGFGLAGCGWRRRAIVIGIVLAGGRRRLGGGVGLAGGRRRAWLPRWCMLASAAAAYGLASAAAWLRWRWLARGCVGACSSGLTVLLVHRWFVVGWLGGWVVAG
jgi:hypothetical protein